MTLAMRFAARVASRNGPVVSIVTRDLNQRQLLHFFGIVPNQERT